MKTKNRPPIAGSKVALLRAADELTRASGTFSAEDLVVSAWKINNQAFGLKGFADQYPDSNKVYSALMGDDGLAKKGWLKKEGPKLYSATEQTTRFLSTLPPTTEIKSKLTKEQEKQFMYYWDTEARSKIEQSRKNEITLADALQFWSITSNDGKEAIQQKLSRPGLLCLDLDPLFQDRKDVTLSNGMVVTAKDVTKLRATHDMLHERFHRHLNLLIDRKR